VIPTLPLGPRNRLAALILAALSDAGARRELAALASADASTLVEGWLGADEPRQRAALGARARRASEALATLPLGSPESSLAAVLEAAATLHDAGLYFEVHELLEPYWARAGGETKEALQGLIQIAVGYAHLANGNLLGARALLEEGSGRVRGRTLGLDLEPFARRVALSLDRLADLDESDVVPFPRARKE
jgi:DUF309 family protein family protein